MNKWTPQSVNEKKVANAVKKTATVKSAKKVKPVNDKQTKTIANSSKGKHLKTSTKSGTSQEGFVSTLLGFELMTNKNLFLFSSATSSTIMSQSVRSFIERSKESKQKKKHEEGGASQDTVFKDSSQPIEVDKDLVLVAQSAPMLATIVTLEANKKKTDAEDEELMRLKQIQDQAEAKEAERKAAKRLSDKKYRDRIKAEKIASNLSKEGVKGNTTFHPPTVDVRFVQICPH